ncbi:redoxin domain-containing protein [Tautonia sociabilis]|uniref:Redoxin domain-containing protein n=1 Tax=Tautonia sociabilis TaxID=2080755 RepID=A0A432MR40_9BACT|nr:redoxin domain-containing protein [Tautonia sociabilis]RUL89408.1 redoxin domain-containing protein [Tautonia sociabilis]
MQIRTVGSIIVAAMLVLGQAGCRNLPRGGLALGRAPEIRTIAGVGARPDRPATREGTPSTISSRVDPPAEGPSSDRVIGQVVDDQGVPVANARVRLAVDGAPAGREVEGTTNRSGRFLLKGLRPGERYTLIAEWDDGDDLLLGRSTVSTPAEEIEIRVASVKEPNRAEVTSGSRFEASGVRLFEAPPQEPDRVPIRSYRPDIPGRMPPPDPGTNRDSRAGWIPSDGVRRASLDPDREESSSVVRASAAPEGPNLFPETERSPVDPPPDRFGALAESSRIPDEIELPEPILDPAPGGALDPPLLKEPSGTRSPSPPSQPSPAPVRPIEERAAPTVRIFEPESEREADQPDPPLLMTDTPPVVEPRDDRTNAPLAPIGADRPGAMRVPTGAPPSREGSPAEDATPERSPIGPDPTIVPDGHGEEMGSFDPEPSPERLADGPRIAPLPDQDPQEARTPARVGPSSDPLEVDRTPGEHPRFELEPNPEASNRVVRWGDLPPPEPLDPRGPEASPPADEGQEPAGSGWGAGLLRLIRPGREEAPAVEPRIEFDAERGRLGDFELPDVQGRPFRLSEANSDYVLLCFWGTWCDPCLAALPHLDELQGQFGPDRLRVVSIAYERNGQGGPRSVSRTARRLGLRFPILLAPADGTCPVASAFEVKYYPTLVLLDREGRVVHRETGATGETLMRLDRAIAAAMAEGVMTVTRH